MLRSEEYDLNDCADFSRMMRTTPPALLHVSAGLITALIFAVIAWAGMTQADLVVNARGRVRSAKETAGIFAPNDLAMIGAVSKVHFQPGDHVQQGAIMVQLNTSMLDNQIEQLQRRIGAQHDELRQLDDTERLIREAYRAKRDRVLAEIQSLEHDSVAQQSRRESELRAARQRLAAAREQEARSHHLMQAKAGSQAEWLAAQTATCEAEERVRQAELPISDGALQTARRSLDVVESEFNLEYNHVATQRAKLVVEIDSAEKECDNLQLKRQTCHLVAPFDGVVTAGHLQPGDVLEPGAMLCEIAPADGFAFEVAVASDNVGDLKLGMPACIRFDTYDPREYGVLPGRISYIAPDSQTPAAASPEIPAASYCVRIDIGQEQIVRAANVGQIKLGLTGAAEMITDRQNLLHIFMQNIRHSVSIR